jgi:hypothetical protein
VTAPRFTLTELWGPLRAAIEQRFSFNDIKKLISRTGVDITSLATSYPAERLGRR